MDNFNQALLLATAAHSGQVDKGGHPYIFHPVSVAAMLAHSEYSEDHVVVALLHDIVEDTDYTLEDLRSYGFGDTVVDAVDAITRRDGETYWDYIWRCGQNEIARAVKLFDLTDNSRTIRMGDKRAEIEGMVRSRYNRALEYLVGPARNPKNRP